MNGIFKVPNISNEPVYSYAPGSNEREAVVAQIKKLRQETVDLPMIIGGKAIRTGKLEPMSPPHDHQHILGKYHVGNKEHVNMAIESALQAKKAWENLPWHERAAVFLRAADLLAGPYRAEANATTLLCQSKTVHQSEIDAVCELVDFWRFNVQYVSELYAMQPESSAGVWNRLEYRALEGFVLAITPFNFTAIAGNLPSAPALMGNTVVWKPAESQIYSAHFVMKILQMAGLPNGVINLIHVPGPELGEIVFNHREFAGLHFTGSTQVFQHLWKTIGTNISQYKSYPRIVGETGGKDFILAHASAESDAVATAITRGAFEFQGQKCSAASRAYLPKSLSKSIIKKVQEQLSQIKYGSPEIISHYFTAVIDARAFKKIVGYIEQAKKDPNVTIIAGGNYDDTIGYFIEPTVILSKSPNSVTMCEEIFGPVITLYEYDDNQWDEILKTVDNTGIYALTGAIFAKDRYAIQQATSELQNAAGNFYVNDKPTGAVVNQQPFGGARGSGTNDKAGSIFNLIRWVNLRTIKETFVSPTDYIYPFMK